MIKRDHAAYPDCGRHIAADYIRWIVHPEVNPREANGHDQQGCGSPDTNFGCA